MGSKHVCSLHHSSRQCWILNPLSEARDRTCNFMVPGAGENLENTMAAFQHAVTIGTDMLELDCHITKDEQVVVSHDENLKRSTGVNVNISDLKYCELPPYLGKLDVSFQKACQCEGKDNRIPLLKEVFEAFPNTPINIDIKVNNNLLIKKVSELVKQYRREHITVWGNASYEIVEKCYKENSDIPILFSLQRVLLILGLFFTGLLPFVPIREQFFEIPMPSIILKLKEPHTMSRSQKFLIWLSDILLMRKALFDHLTARGIQVSFWNDAFYFFCLAEPASYASPQARGRIGAIAAGLHHSHSNTGSEPHLRSTPQLTATLDP
uniref:Glycerophosphodiester phosphodiesterase domain containing 1 n=1 Tax=Sus scrofa TaxID=9823 RepID=A0A8D0RRC0_PIG